MTGPLRETTEELTSSIPSGPLGFVGGGNLIGLSGMIIVGGTSVAIPGDEFDPGYEVKGEEITANDGVERHKFRINAYSKNVAEVVAKVRSSPTNIDLLTDKTELVRTQEVTERNTASTWEVIVDVSDRSLL